MIEFEIGTERWRARLTSHNQVYIEQVVDSAWKLWAVGDYAGPVQGRYLVLSTEEGRFGDIHREGAEFVGYLQPIRTRVPLGPQRSLHAGAVELVRQLRLRSMNKAVA